MRECHSASFRRRASHFRTRPRPLAAVLFPVSCCLLRVFVVWCHNPWVWDLWTSEWNSNRGVVRCFAGFSREGGRRGDRPGFVRCVEVWGYHHLMIAWLTLCDVSCCSFLGASSSVVAAVVVMATGPTVAASAVVVASSKLVAPAHPC